jgi:UDP-glucose 4-epimerase
MNVLVVGGAGYVGSHCVHELKRQGHSPVVLDNLVYGHKEALLEDVPFYQIDMGDIDSVRKVLRDESIEIVMHYAAFAYVGESVKDPLKYYLNNVGQSLKLLEAMQLEGVKKFIFSSSCTVYGTPAKLPITETMEKQPINPYGQTKLDMENALKSLAHTKSISFAAFRYFNAAGSSEDGSIGEDHTPETHLLPIVFETALGKRDHMCIWGDDYDTPDGTCLRDYVHVDDLARAHILVFDKLKHPGQALFYNLGTGTPNSVLEVIKMVEDVTGKKVEARSCGRREGDPASLYANASKAKDELGWEPKFKDLRSIVETVWTWYQKHPDGYLSAPR